MLHLPITDVKKTHFYQEVFTQGREPGREGAGRGLILRQLQRRWGALTPEDEKRIRALSSA